MYPPAYLSLARFPGDPAERLAQYLLSKEDMDAVGADHGLLVHAAAPTPDGFLVVNVWASRRDSEAAARDPRRLSALERLGLDPAAIEREHHLALALTTRGPLPAPAPAPGDATRPLESPPVRRG